MSFKIKNYMPTKDNKIKIGIVSAVLIIGYVLAMLTPMFVTILLVVILGGLGFIGFKLLKELESKVNEPSEND